jgi:uncharacterized protein (DUF2249 family)
MKTYVGVREGNQTTVTVNGKPLDPRLDLANKSPSGFEWGYLGSGPAQLALAILADHLEDDRKAQSLFQRFKEHVIAPIQDDAWSIDSSEIDRALAELNAQD